MPARRGGRVIEIDGTMGEGGGQMLGSAWTLSLVTGRSVRLQRIRARRVRPGLRCQHLLTQAEVIRRFLPARIPIDGAPGGPGTVRVDP
jgi:RNA 3'-terminal phosphate cyclase